MKGACLVRPLLALLLFCGCAAPPAARAGVTVERDVPYAVGHIAATPEATAFAVRPLLLDVYRPDAAARAPRPAVVLLHGGSFREGTKDHDDLTGLARYLAERGYVCFAADYRLMDDNPPAAPPFNLTSIQRAVHAAAVDAKAAVRYVRARHADYGVDPNRIALCGDSAGSIAALLAGLTGEDRFVQDCPELPVPKENHPGVSSRPDAIVELWGSAELVLDEVDAQDPPVLIVHGTKDKHIGVYFSAALSLKAACERAGVPHVFRPLEGAKHGAWDAEFEGQSVPAFVHAFLEEYLRPRPARTP